MARCKATLGELSPQPVLGIDNCKTNGPLLLPVKAFVKNIVDKIITPIIFYTLFLHSINPLKIKGSLILLAVPNF